MQITLNNNIELIEAESLTIAELIRLKNYTFRMLVTKINGKLVRKEERETAIVRDGDDVTILHLISGG